ncbi:metal-sulfur cluster assembly factor [Gracilibacillus saliphilus]|uniref:metal-sulfur cluster assembly factor n=1 Tax=Gracilibacillus saliphilus TaxID=543890 RepID=UPI0013D68E7F|nr:metal-sulfur cluster assembly factor [Gracilibacillus saliphilus]
MDREVIEEALYEVIDPELAINIVDLGLVYDILIAESNDVLIKMTLTTPGCPMHDSIVNGVKKRLLQIDEIENVTVELVWEPAWNPSQMSLAAQKQLFG